MIEGDGSRIHVTATTSSIYVREWGVVVTRCEALADIVGNAAGRSYMPVEYDPAWLTCNTVYQEPARSGSDAIRVAVRHADRWFAAVAAEIAEVTPREEMPEWLAAPLADDEYERLSAAMSGPDYP